MITARGYGAARLASKASPRSKFDVNKSAVATSAANTNTEKLAMFPTPTIRCSGQTSGETGGGTGYPDGGVTSEMIRR